MSQTEDRVPDLDEMMEKIRREVVRRRAARASAPTFAAPLSSETSADARQELAGIVSRARQHVEVSASLPEASQLPRAKRLVATRLGGLIMGQLHHLRSRQTAFNREVAQALEALTLARAELDNALQRIARLEEVVRGKGLAPAAGYPPPSETTDERSSDGAEDEDEAEP